MAFAAIAFTILGGVATAIGQLNQARAQSSAANYQSQVANINAQIARENADYETMRGEVEAQREGLKVRGQVGAITAEQGASNLDVTSGSPAAVRESAQKLGTYNEALIRSDAARRRTQFLTEGFQEQAKSRLYGLESKYYRQAGPLQATGTLLGTAASVSGKWYQYGGSSMFS